MHLKYPRPSYRWPLRDDYDAIGVFLLTLNNFTPCSAVSIVNFEQAIDGWAVNSTQFGNRWQKNTWNYN